MNCEKHGKRLFARSEYCVDCLAELSRKVQYMDYLLITQRNRMNELGRERDRAREQRDALMKAAANVLLDWDGRCIPISQKHLEALREALMKAEVG